MGAGCWTGISEAKFVDSERRVLAHSGLDYEKDFKIKNVVIDSLGNYIRTIEIENPGKPVLVMIHGYGASGVIFWKIFKKLKE